MKTLISFLASFGIAFGIMVTVRYASADDAGVVMIEPMAGSAVAVEAGSAAPSVTVNAGSGATVNVAPPMPTGVPDPVEDPGGAIDALTALYTKGALTPFFYLLGFFMLVYAERKVKWLAVGYRKVCVSSLLYAAGMLAERAIAGTTPTMAMAVTALGGAALFAFKAVGPKAPVAGAVA